jgi:4-amino-4-deoxy-L-arabinose transferase-like glycosyltransferase
MSSLFSIGCVVLLYVAVLSSGGDRWQAIVAAGLMGLSPIQVYYSQQARPYTLLEFIALLGGILFISIERKGLSRLKLIGLALAVLALALTHYVSAGLIVAWGIYCCVRLRGRPRRGAALAIGIAVLVAVIAWGPHLLAYRRTNPAGGYGELRDRNLAHLTLSVPQRLTAESNQDPLLLADSGPLLLVIGLGVICYAIPLFYFPTRRYLLFWWVWTAGVIGLVLLVDIVRHSTPAERNPSRDPGCARRICVACCSSSRAAGKVYSVGDIIRRGRMRD